MDYGYKAALQAGLQVYENASRASGRTARMIERVNPDDVIVCADGRAGHFIQQRLRDAGKQAHVVVCDPTPYALDERMRGIQARVFFEHTWELRYWEQVLASAAEALRSRTSAP